PLDAGIIRSFKVKYGRFMIRVIADYIPEPPKPPKKSSKPGKMHNKQPATPSVPNRLFYPGFVQAWKEVTVATIRNCFAHVPTIPAAMADLLRVRVDYNLDEELQKLKDELKELFPSLAHRDAIDAQTDYCALAVLGSCTGKGPAPRMMEAIMAVSKKSEFQHYFVSPEDMVAINEDKESDESDDSDFSPSESESDSFSIASSWIDWSDEEYVQFQTTLEEVAHDLSHDLHPSRVKDPAVRENMKKNLRQARRTIEIQRDILAMNVPSEDYYHEYNGAEPLADEHPHASEDDLSSVSSLPQVDLTYDSEENEEYYEDLRSEDLYSQPTNDTAERDGDDEVDKDDMVDDLAVREENIEENSSHE
ncbi:hypothetical protein BGZ83_005502, partial [Gryganskiella cystojenkinii]